MGAREAIEILNMLAAHRTANRRTVREYVMEALCGGAEMSEGTQAYESLIERLFREMEAEQGRAEPELDPEVVYYLRAVLDVATGDRAALSFGEPYDGFSREAYEDVYDLLGPAGRRYLGIGAWPARESLAPNPRIVRAMIEDEADAESEELEEADGQSHGPLAGPPAGGGDPYDRTPLVADGEPLVEFEPEEPWHEPFPPMPGFGIRPGPGQRERGRG